MSWFKIDDGFFDNLKIATLSDAAQLAYIKGGVYCARNLTDGVIPLRKAEEFAGKALKELVPDLWAPSHGEFLIHDYLEYNPSRAQVLAERERSKRRRTGERPANNRRTTGEQPAKDHGTIRDIRGTYGG